MNRLLCFDKTKKIIEIFVLVLVALSGSSFSITALAQTSIEVFVDQPLVTPFVPGAMITVFDIARASLLQKTIPKFSQDSALGQSQASAWLVSPDGKAHIAQLKDAYAAHQKMMLYGIEKIPAIVFEHGKFVIYGITDVRQAVADYDQFIRTHKNDLTLTRDQNSGGQYE
jgi:integrating conjugative element protein (TIGR03757 family)